MIQRPSKSRVFAIILWLMTWLTFATARWVEQASLLVSALKSAGYMMTCILATAILEFAVLGPLPDEEEDDD